jgi:hypothetical protein
MVLLDGTARWYCSMVLLDGTARWYCSMLLMRTAIPSLTCEILASFLISISFPQGKEMFVHEGDVKTASHDGMN